jgi:hypothetical protein
VVVEDDAEVLEDDVEVLDDGVLDVVVGVVVAVVVAGVAVPSAQPPDPASATSRVSPAQASWRGLFSPLTTTVGSLPPPSSSWAHARVVPAIRRVKAPPATTILRMIPTSVLGRPGRRLTPRILRPKVGRRCPRPVAAFGGGRCRCGAARTACRCPRTPRAGSPPGPGTFVPDGGRSWQVLGTRAPPPGAAPCGCAISRAVCPAMSCTIVGRVLSASAVPAR